MNVIVEHHGDRKTSPEESQQLAVDSYDAVMETWPHADDTMSKFTDVKRVWTDKLSQKRLDLAGYGEVVLPNVEIIEVRPDE